MQESFPEVSLGSITPHQKTLQSGIPDTTKTTLGKSTTAATNVVEIQSGSAQFLNGFCWEQFSRFCKTDMMLN